MKEQFLIKSLGLIQHYHAPYTEDELDRLRYGLEGVYLTVTKLIVIGGLAFLLHIALEVLILLVLFNIIRYTGFGVHAENSTSCLITSILFFIVIPYILLHISILPIIKGVICLCCLVLYLLYAPADTKKRPFKNEKKRIIRKVATLITGIIFTIALFIVPNTMIQTMLLSALIIEAIVISPLTYKLLGQPYNNGKAN
ncbi:MAG: accessory gene regulator B family protein [Bacilli bacterium]